MNFSVVLLKSNRYVVVPTKWIKNPIVGEQSVVFHSPHADSDPDFELKREFYLNQSSDACYDAFVYKIFGNKFIQQFQIILIKLSAFIDEKTKADEYAANKRLVKPINYKSGNKFDVAKCSNEVMASIVLSDDEHELSNTTEDEMISQGDDSETGDNIDFIEDEPNGIGDDVVFNENHLSERQMNANTDSKDSNFVLTGTEQLEKSNHDGTHSMMNLNVSLHIFALFILSTFPHKNLIMFDFKD